MGEERVHYGLALIPKQFYPDVTHQSIGFYPDYSGPVGSQVCQHASQPETGNLASDALQSCMEFPYVLMFGKAHPNVWRCFPAIQQRQNAGRNGKSLLRDPTAKMLGEVARQVQLSAGPLLPKHPLHGNSVPVPHLVNVPPEEVDVFVVGPIEGLTPATVAGAAKGLAETHSP